MTTSIRIPERDGSRAGGDEMIVVQPDNAVRNHWPER